MATATAPKTFSGTFLVPGVSLNGRLYTKEMIGKAVARMQTRIADPDGLPISMRTSHGAGDDSQLIVARVTGAKQQSDGSATYEARWYDTAPARDIAALVHPADGGPPGLRSVSIHGYFLGETRKVEVAGVEALTSDDLEVTHIDFTGTPGVVKALINAPGQRPAESVADAHSRTPIFETWEVPVGEEVIDNPADVDAAVVESTAAEDEAYTAAQKRDALKAGQAMKNASGKPSYTIKNKADLRRAIRAVGRGGADHDAIRKHVIDRAKALGLSAMIPDNWNADGSLKESATATRFGEIRECYDCGPDGRAGFAIDAYNGPVSLTLRAPSLDPSGLRAIATAAMTAALDALGALDPDFDADIDVPGAPAADTDGDMGAGEAAPGDPDAATPDDDEDPPDPGDPCSCGCGCAVPANASPDPGCPCACGCEVCCAAGAETAVAPTAPTAESTAVAVQGEPGPELEAPAPAGYAAPIPAPEAAPNPPTPVEESAVSETAAPAAEAATPTAPPPAPAQPMIGFTQEQFTQLLAAIRPPVAEAAPAAPVVAAPQDAVPTDATPAPATPAAPAQEAAAQPSVEEAVTAALTKALPGLRDSLVSQYGLPPRRGYRTAETDTNGGALTPEQMWDQRADLLLGDLGRVPAAG